jgi:predicted pyridoxine 5'-phosphate oxidase superfamily flavin-nucleotide-binding protein
MKMSEFYSDGHRALQEQFDTRKLADGLEQKLMRQVLAEMDEKFIASCDMFFLSSVDHQGWPTVSYKGGFPGFVKIIDSQTLAFPCYDGNGMFYSMGNVSQNGRIGLLFIDFERPRRLRLHGTATVSADDPLMAEYHEANLVVRVAIRNIFTNCGRYIHKYTREAASEYVPQADVETPTPDWKRVEAFQEFLPERDRGAAEKAGGVISEQEYRKDFWKGLD